MAFLLQKLFCGNCWMDRAPSISLMGSPALDYLPRNQNRLKISKLLSCQTRFSPPLRFSPEIQKAQISMLIMFMVMMMPMKMMMVITMLRKMMMPMKMIVDLEPPSAHFAARSEWSAPIRKEEIPRKYHICPSINVAISMWKYIQGNICGNIITVCGCSMRRWITGSNIRKYQEIKWKCKGNAKEMQGNSRKCKEMPGNARKCKEM